jgi:hypothetical protein
MYLNRSQIINTKVFYANSKLIALDTQHIHSPRPFTATTFTQYIIVYAKRSSMTLYSVNPINAMRFCQQSLLLAHIAYCTSGI